MVYLKCLNLFISDMIHVLLSTHSAGLGHRASRRTKSTLALSGCAAWPLTAGRLGRGLNHSEAQGELQKVDEINPTSSLTFEGDGALGESSCNFAYCANGISA
jgi:hypothetical protein